MLRRGHLQYNPNDFYTGFDATAKDHDGMTSFRTTLPGAIAFAILICLTAALLTTPVRVTAQAGLDRDLLAEIMKIKAIDNHAHPVKYVADGEPADTEFDALPLDAIAAFPLPVRLSPTNPEFIRAWHDLYGYSHNDMNEAHVRELLNAKQAVLKQRSDGTPAWILDQVNIETMFANRVAMGRGLNPPRFRWVPFDDALIFPLSNE